jgi:hypothetical protein
MEMKKIGTAKKIVDPDPAGATQESRVTIPTDVPKAEKLPPYKISVTNFGDKEETAEKAIQWVKNYNHDFRAQNAWDEYEDEMDIADEMYRAAATRTTLNSDQSDNVKSTGSKIKSATFYAEVRAITSGESAIMLDKDNDLPVVYEPLPDSEEYTEKLGQQLALERNAVLGYTMEKAGMRDDIRKLLWSMNKYGNVAVEMQWDYRKEERSVREPTAFEGLELPDGTLIQRPTKFKRKTKTVTIADNPRLIIHDMRNVRFDAMIDNVQDQS